MKFVFRFWCWLVGWLIEGFCLVSVSCWCLFCVCVCVFFTKIRDTFFFAEKKEGIKSNLFTF